MLEYAIYTARLSQDIQVNWSTWPKEYRRQGRVRVCAQEDPSTCSLFLLRMIEYRIINSLRLDLQRQSFTFLSELPASERRPCSGGVRKQMYSSTIYTCLHISSWFCTCTAILMSTPSSSLISLEELDKCVCNGSSSCV